MEELAFAVAVAPASGALSVDAADGASVPALCTTNAAVPEKLLGEMGGTMEEAAAAAAAAAEEVGEATIGREAVELVVAAGSIVRLEAFCALPPSFFFAGGTFAAVNNSPLNTRLQYSSVFLRSLTCSWHFSHKQAVYVCLLTSGPCAARTQSLPRLSGCCTAGG